MSNRELNVELRTEYGKNECNRLRAEGFIPAVLYSHGNSETIKVPVKAFTSIFKGHISESILIDLNITDKTEDAAHTAFVKDYNLDPVSNQILHVDFYKITAGEKIRTSVQVEVEGTPNGVKEGGILEIFERELEIECLPKDMPESIVIDVSHLNIGESFRISDINMGEAVKFLDSGERPIASVVAPHVKEEAEVKEAAEGEETAEPEKAEEEESKDKE